MRECDPAGITAVPDENQASFSGLTLLFQSPQASADSAGGPSATDMRVLKANGLKEMRLIRQRYMQYYAHGKLVWPRSILQRNTF